MFMRLYHGRSASRKAPYGQKAYAAYARVASEDQVRLRVQH